MYICEYILDIYLHMYIQIDLYDMTIATSSSIGSNGIKLVTTKNRAHKTPSTNIFPIY